MEPDTKSQPEWKLEYDLKLEESRSTWYRLELQKLDKQITQLTNPSQMTQTIINETQEIKHLAKELQSVTQVSFLSESQVIPSKTHHKLIRTIRDKIEYMSGKKIRGSRVLYRMTEVLNPFQFVEGVKNVLVACRLKSERIVGVWSNAMITTEKSSKDSKNMTKKNAEGLIFSYTPSQTNFFYSSSPESPFPIFTPDPCFLIWGNSQLRIQKYSSQLYSNFGISRSHFDTMNLPVNQFLGEGAQRKVQMDSYELIQVFFEGEQQQRRDWYIQKKM